MTGLTSLPPQLIELLLLQPSAAAMAFVLGVLLMPGLILAAYRLLDEWQRRVTLNSALNAPGGSVIVHEKHGNHSTTKVWVGMVPPPAAPPAAPVYLIVQVSAAAPVFSAGAQR